MAIRASVLTALLATAMPAWGDDCRLALVLALDVSDSVDATEDRLQREGLARALLAPEVVRAFLRDNHVAISVFEWADEDFQADIAGGWHMVRSEDDLARIAAAVRSIPARDQQVRTTAVGAALLYGATILNEGPDCASRTVDISSDGKNNGGLSPQFAYADPLFDGVTVNALVIGGARNQPRLPYDGRLVAWYEANVLRGEDAFCVFAEGYEDYERAMRAKLLREIDFPLVSWRLLHDDAG